MEVAELKGQLDQHVLNFEEYKSQEADKFNKLLSTQQNNTDAISKLTASLATLVDDTSAVVQLQKDFAGAARVGKGVQDFMIWCMKWGAIGVGTATCIAWVIQKFNH